MKKFYIADWHYGHGNVIGFDNRPFVDVDEMNKELIRRWNSVVSSGDIVYVLGDMFWCTPKVASPIMDELNGQKFLIKGNHAQLLVSKDGWVIDTGNYENVNAEVARRLVRNIERHPILWELFFMVA